MGKEFKRAKSLENKEIRIHQIMEVTDRLFHETNYHDVTLSTISEAAGFARGGLYKYVASKEEIFLMIYQENQEKFIHALQKEMGLPSFTWEQFPKLFSIIMEQHLDFLKYHQILNAIIETNITIERLAQFKLHTNHLLHEIFPLFESHFQCTYEQFFDLYLTFVYHGLYLHDRAAYTNAYIEAMKIAKLPIADIVFQDEYADYITMYLMYHYNHL